MEHSFDLDVDCPVRTVYDQWTQFSDFPLFMEHVEEIRQIDDRRLDWTVRIAGVSRSWRAEVTEQTPDQRVAWTSTDGTRNRGAVSFHALDDERTRVRLQIEMDPEGFLETVADWGGFVSDRAKKDLRSFKDFIEQRGRATGGWRGEIERPANRAETVRRRELGTMSKDDLVDLASERQIDGRSNMTRDELIDALANEPRPSPSSES